MIGGTIIQTEEIPKSGKLRLDIVTDQYKDKHSVFVELNDAARCIQEDDSAFWHEDRDGGTVFWSPKLRTFHDYPLKKIGKSFQTEKADKKELVGK
jgi:hypothetical protein